MPLKQRALALLKGQKQILLSAEFFRNQREESRSFKAKFILCTQDYWETLSIGPDIMAHIKILIIPSLEILASKQTQWWSSSTEKNKKSFWKKYPMWEETQIDSKSGPNQRKIILTLWHSY